MKICLNVTMNKLSKLTITINESFTGLAINLERYTYIKKIKYKTVLIL